LIAAKTTKKYKKKETHSNVSKKLFCKINTEIEDNKTEYKTWKPIKTWKSRLGWVRLNFCLPGSYYRRGH